MDYGMMGGDSECSSGCESGWTLYLENSYITCCKGEKSLKQKQEETEEEEDLSMVSDASSGPPNFHQEEEYGHNNIINGAHYYAPISNPIRKLCTNGISNPIRKSLFFIIMHQLVKKLYYTN